MEDANTPLLGGINRSGAMEGKDTDWKEKMSTENVVNIAGDKPSAIFLILLCGLLSFNTVSWNQILYFFESQKIQFEIPSRIQVNISEAFSWKSSAKNEHVKLRHFTQPDDRHGGVFSQLWRLRAVFRLEMSTD